MKNNNCLFLSDWNDFEMRMKGYLIADIIQNLDCPTHPRILRDKLSYQYYRVRKTSFKINGLNADLFHAES